MTVKNSDDIHDVISALEDYAGWLREEWDMNYRESSRLASERMGLAIQWLEATVGQLKYVTNELGKE